MTLRPNPSRRTWLFFPAMQRIRKVWNMRNLCVGPLVAESPVQLDFVAQPCHESSSVATDFVGPRSSQALCDLQTSASIRRQFSSSRTVAMMSCCQSICNKIFAAFQRSWSSMVYHNARNEFHGQKQLCCFVVRVRSGFSICRSEVGKQSNK